MRKIEFYSRPLTSNFLLPFITVILLSCFTSLHAQQRKAAKDTIKESLAIQLKNPVNNLKLLPLQNNTEFDVGGQGITRNTLKIEPVLPFVLNKEWRLLTRTIIPVIYQEGLSGENGKFGIGDINVTAWLAPNYKINGWVWGAGLVLNLPTATTSYFGYQKWAAGPSAVVVKQKGGLTLGLLANQMWSFGGPGPSEVNIAFVDPWFSYTWANSVSVDLESESVYDWKQEQWTVPIRFGVGKLFELGKTPVSLALDGLYYVERGIYDPKWGVSLTATFVFN